MEKKLPTEPHSIATAPTMPVLDIRSLRVSFGAAAPILDGLDIHMNAGDLLCIVGESGSGKSVTALSTMGLLPKAAHISADRMTFLGKDMLSMSERDRENLRGNRMAMVFQEPMTSLNPVMSVGDQIMEPLIQHQKMNKTNAREKALAMLRRVHIPAPEERFDQYPHQLSGGLRQRVMIAMALVCRPALLIADEPTTALDVTIQSQILRLIDELRTELGTAVLFITHDLAVVSEIADHIVVVYAGRIVEEGTRTDLFSNPQHPYTLSLFAAMPQASDLGKALAAIDGQVPSVDAMPLGCRFAPRCPFAIAQCHAEQPPLNNIGTGHMVACWRAPLEKHIQ
ncbi:ABC transporter ATP-binding protein [Loktanella salsilacus]|uniref:ABC transporter ATP-binding protein n=1 Tax=Loktanella salsilacus TaxID=195913 RepID=UPI00373699A8